MEDTEADFIALKGLVTTNHALIDRLPQCQIFCLKEVIVKYYHVMVWKDTIAGKMTGIRTDTLGWRTQCNAYNGIAMQSIGMQCVWHGQAYHLTPDEHLAHPVILWYKKIIFQASTINYRLTILASSNTPAGCYAASPPYELVSAYTSVRVSVDKYHIYLPLARATM